MAAKPTPSSRISGLKSLAGVAVMGAFFLVFALAAGGRARPAPSPDGALQLDGLRAGRARLEHAVEGLYDPDAAVRGRSARAVLRIARQELPAAAGGRAGQALAERAAGLAHLAGSPPAAGGPFEREAERLLGFLDAWLEMDAGEPAAAPALR